MIKKIKGFSLVETVLTLTIIAIVGVLLVLSIQKPFFWSLHFPEIMQQQASIQMAITEIQRDLEKPVNHVNLIQMPNKTMLNFDYGDKKIQYLIEHDSKKLMRIDLTQRTRKTLLVGFEGQFSIEPITTGWVIHLSLTSKKSNQLGTIERVFFADRARVLEHAS